MISRSCSVLGEEVVLLVAWALRISLEEQCLEATDLAKELLIPGDPLDLLRPQASASPRDQDRPRIGLIVQPFFWALALSIVDLVTNQRRGTPGFFHTNGSGRQKGSLYSLETGDGLDHLIIERTCSFVEEAATTCLPASSSITRRGWLAELFGVCEACPEAFPCHRFSSTACRPDICLCAHGATHHSCMRPCDLRPTASQKADNGLPPGASLSASPRIQQGSDEIVASSKGTKTSRCHHRRPRATDDTVQVLKSASRFLRSIGPAGIRDLLGLRRTAGSLDGPLPPSRATLLASLNLLHAPLAPKVTNPTAPPPDTTYTTTHAPDRPTLDRRRKGKRKPPAGAVRLTVGGRALCKHSPRGREVWWGPDGGTEEDKSARAERVVLRIFRTATWVNLHAFGGGGSDGVFEVRESKGYGARWSVDGNSFRGFLEPHMENGHSKGWKH